mmetsp:Transcript_41589/g.100171  ORF Transcript_41589/g.100171 Transcript_41589/m.100171 type:complete len:230 (+) Transcript_41589:1964-2653(+)
MCAQTIIVPLDLSVLESSRHPSNDVLVIELVQLILHLSLNFLLQLCFWGGIFLTFCYLFVVAPVLLVPFSVVILFLFFFFHLLLCALCVIHSTLHVITNNCFAILITLQTLSHVEICLPFLIFFLIKVIAVGSIHGLFELLWIIVSFKHLHNGHLIDRFLVDRTQDGLDLSKLFVGFLLFRILQAFQFLFLCFSLGCFSFFASFTFFLSRGVSSSYCGHCISTSISLDR